MSRICAAAGLTALLIPLLIGFSRPAAAEFFGCDDQHKHRHVSYRAEASLAYRAETTGSYRAGSQPTLHYAQAAPPRVTIYPRHEPKRYCRSWLETEYRLSGPVVVPRMRCSWR